MADFREIANFGTGLAGRARGGAPLASLEERFWPSTPCWFGGLSAAVKVTRGTPPAVLGGGADAAREPELPVHKYRTRSSVSVFF